MTRIPGMISPSDLGKINSAVHTPLAESKVKNDGTKNKKFEVELSGKKDEGRSPSGR